VAPEFGEILWSNIFTTKQFCKGVINHELLHDQGTIGIKDLNTPAWRLLL